ncbi:MAG: sporulation protein [Ruminococcaceae bacterium]|nr:sporulation protein [Oscillospiraceae bacterium]
MGKNKQILQRVASAVDLPDEPFPGQPLVEIIGTRRVLIENYRGVIEYGDALVRIRVKYGSITVCGKHLELTRMTREHLIISGRIDKVELCRG